MKEKSLRDPGLRVLFPENLRSPSSGRDVPAGDAAGAGVRGQGQEGRAHHHLPRQQLEGEGEAGGLLQAAPLPHPRSKVLLDRFPASLASGSKEPDKGTTCRESRFLVSQRVQSHVELGSPRPK